MKVSTLITIASVLITSNAASMFGDSILKNFFPNMTTMEQEGPYKIPAFAVNDAAKVARTLIKYESISNVVALDDKTGTPVSFAEYFIDGLNTGDPVLPIMHLSSTRRNVEYTQRQGKEVSISIRSYDHDYDATFPEKFVYPGSFPKSIAGAPRVSMKGKLVPLNVTSSQDESLSNLIISKHDDAELFVPDAGLGASWNKFEIEEIYLLGGFGGLAFIGNIPVDEYHTAVPYTEEELNHWRLGW